ncbi:Helitron helicase-like domain at N-terminus [Ceratobasidium sp. AG-Ba]|nr:Helitron helicase-like domain at N-terminus [Ceratobasidium sp. AG-Ba]
MSDIDFLYDSLTVPDIIRLLSGCPPNELPQINSSLKRDKRRLIETLLGKGPYWAEKLNHLAADHNDESLRKRREKRLRHAEHIRETREKQQQSCSTADFLGTPAATEYQTSYKEAFKSTTNAALQELVCAICARILNVIDAGIVTSRLDELPNIKRLRPVISHDAYILIDDCLLEEKGCTRCGDCITINTCQDCRNDLQEETDVPPRLSLANNLWIGRVPWQLECLTIVEHLLIARVYPRVFIVKLFPRGGSCRGLRDNQLQSALRGNVTSFELNSDAIADMISGNLMPQRPAILASVLSVTFIGRGKAINPAALQMFCVRRDLLVDALLWLKNNNQKYYGDIEIDSERLAELPVNGVPQAVQVNFRFETDDTMIEAESGGYVSDAYIDDNEDSEAMAPTIDPSDSSDDDPTVIPLQCLGVMDNDLSKLTSNELMAWGLRNMQSQDVKNRSEWGYAVRYGAPVNTFGQPPKGKGPADPNRRNFWEAAFPILYPYGVGGIESDRPSQVSFLEHVRWSLQYHDRRFRHHNSFLFAAFGIQQRRQALSSAKIQMRRKDFDTIAHTLGTITPADLRLAAQEEAQGQRPSNPAIQVLYRHITATSRRVMASGPARTQLRSQIFSAAMYFNQPTIWLTINPDDLHDPIAQIFAGQEIDMDNFIRTAGPNRLSRSQNIAQDPFAAAKFFHFTIKLVLEKLFGIKSTKTHVHSRTGVLGNVKAYFGTVECQGRGTLHLHMLLWLENSPPPRQLKAMLQTSEFRARVLSYIRANVRSYVSQFTTPEELKATPIDAEIAYSRSPNPELPLPEFQRELRQLEAKVVRAKQIHKCEFGKCLRYDRYGKLSCKRRAPWELSDKDSVDNNGTYQTRRSLAFLNSYCPAIAHTIKCNHDIKLLLHGDETKHLGFYITKYMTKPEGRSHNVASLLAEGLTRHYEEDPTTKDFLTRQHDLILRSVNVLNREQEIPAPLAVINLMGWGEHMCSHYPENIYWNHFLSHIHTYPDLSAAGPLTEERNTNANDFPLGDPTQAQINERSPELEQESQNSENIILEFNGSGKLYRKSQVEDYIYRSDNADIYNVLDYFVGTYEQPVSRGDFDATTEKSGAALNNCPEDRSNASTKRPGRPTHPRLGYQSPHPRHKTHVRVDPAQSKLYAASVLTFLKPWRSVEDLKSPGQSWDDALDKFLATAPERILNIIDNIEYRHEAQTAAEEKQSSSYISEEVVAGADEEELMDIDDPESANRGPDCINSCDITPEMLQKAKSELEDRREAVHGIAAVRIAQAMGAFKSHQAPIRSCQDRATSADMGLLSDWLHRLKVCSQHIEYPGHSENTGTIEPGDVGAVEPLSLVQYSETTSNGPDAILPRHEKPISPISPTQLYPQQGRAVGIFHWHLMRLLYSEDYDPSLRPPQLRMLLVGPGGTGKSQVLQNMTEAIKQARVEYKLIKGSYTGCAASLIEGETTHHLARIPVGKKNYKLSAEAKKELVKKWGPVSYLIIDEFSMLSKEFIAELSRNISIGKLGYSMENGDLPFGGINVILSGDHHQIEPVAVPLGGALYYPANSPRFTTTPEALLGRKIYESFEHVVILKQQVRVKDPRWQAFLQNFRQGCVTSTDILLLDSITLTNPKCRPTDFESEKWLNACLITPRNAVRIRWNDACVTRHCQRTGHQLFICPAFDTCVDNGSRRPITLYEQYASIKNASSKRNPRKGRREKNGLPDEVPIAIGLKIMVTLNVDTNIDVTNGARGEIVGIKLDPNEPRFSDEDSVVSLQRLPAYILVKLNRTRAATLPGLEDGVIPIIPACKSYSLTLPIRKGGRVDPVKRNFRRLQFPITPAYAFTDYRSQGQTIEAAFVDIATPPTGGELEKSNVYVAVSRVSCLDDIRLLREFNRDILKRPMEPELRQEEERLERLDSLTEKWWHQISE